MEKYTQKKGRTRGRMKFPLQFKKVKFRAVGRTIIPTTLLLSSLLFGCGRGRPLPYTPRLVSINIVDRNGLSETVSNNDRIKQYERVNFISPQPYQKVMRVYNRRPNGDIEAVITTYHENGQVKQLLELLNNRAFGRYNEWYENGQLKIDALVIGGIGDVGPSDQKSWLFDGVCRAYSEKGALEAEVFYDKGSLEGVTKHYHPNGMLWKAIPYVKDKIEGKEEIYLSNGQLLQTTEYRGGEKEGLSLRYWGEEAIAAQELYNSGKLMQGEYFDSRGRKVASIEKGEGFRALFGVCEVAELHEYHGGELHGEVQLFTEEGKLFNSYQVVKGRKHGEEVEYYDGRREESRPLPKISISWYEGVMQGSVKSWYSNGNMESQREMSKNQKNGLLTAWYEDGSLMLVEEYEQDRLTSGKYFRKGEKMPISKVLDGTGVATLFDSEGNYLYKVNYLKGTPSL